MRPMNRRVFLIAPAAATTLVVPVPSALAALRRVEESEPKATAIGYRHDSARVDQARYPKHQVTQKCENCLAWAPEKPTDEWGECDLMSDRMVNRNGWCSSYKQRKG